MLFDPKWENPVLRTFLNAREMLSERTRWASSYDELGQTTHCLSTAFGMDFTAHAEFLRANGLCADAIFSGVINFNDTHTHAEVLAALDRAIETTRAKAEPAP